MIRNACRAGRAGSAADGAGGCPRRAVFGGPQGPRRGAPLQLSSPHPCSIRSDGHLSPVTPSPCCTVNIGGATARGAHLAVSSGTSLAQGTHLRGQPPAAPSRARDSRGRPCGDAGIGQPGASCCPAEPAWHGTQHSDPAPAPAPAQRPPRAAQPAQVVCGAGSSGSSGVLLWR